MHGPAADGPAEGRGRSRARSKRRGQGPGGASPVATATAGAANSRADAGEESAGDAGYRGVLTRRPGPGPGGAPSRGVMDKPVLCAHRPRGCLARSSAAHARRRGRSERESAGRAAGGRPLCLRAGVRGAVRGLQGCGGWVLSCAGFSPVSVMPTRAPVDPARAIRSGTTSFHYFSLRKSLGVTTWTQATADPRRASDIQVWRGCFASSALAILTGSR